MEGSGRCSAAFCESAALRESFCLAQAGGTLSVFASQIHLPRKGEVLLYLPEGAEKLPLRGNLARERLRGRRSEQTERVSLRTLPKKAGNISLSLREWGLFCIESRLQGAGGI